MSAEGDTQIIDALVEKGDFEQAIDTIEETLTDPALLDIKHWVCGKKCLAIGDLEGALEAFDGYFTNDGNSKGVLFKNNPVIFERCSIERGNTYLLLGQAGVAKICFDMALFCNPSSRPARYGLVRALSSLGDHASATKTLDEATEIIPEKPETHFCLLQATLALGRIDAARELCGTLDITALIEPEMLKATAKLCGKLGLKDKQQSAQARLRDQTGLSAPRRISAGIRDYWTKLRNGPAIRQATPMASLLNLAAAGFALLMRAVYPLIKIRVRGLYSARIGHLVVENVAYLGEKKAGLQGGPRNWNVFYWDGFICNRQFVKILQPFLSVSPFFQRVENFSKTLPHAKRHYAPIIAKDIFKQRDIHRAMTDRTLVSLTGEEDRWGWHEVEKMGLSEQTPFVLFHERDAAYLRNLNPTVDSTGHDFRDGSIENFVDMALTLIGRGYKVVRMGAECEIDLPDFDPGFINYAKYFRTDFLDVFLSAHCRFMVAGTAGLKYLATTFGRPLVSVNRIPLHQVETFVDNLLIIPKKIWFEEARRFLTFREILDTPIGSLDKTEYYTKLGLQPLINSADEIMAVCLEMDERMNGTWVSTEEDEELQTRFWSLWDGIWPQAYERRPTARIGMEFLRSNSDLLD